MWLGQGQRRGNRKRTEEAIFAFRLLPCSMERVRITLGLPVPVRRHIESFSLACGCLCFGAVLFKMLGNL